MFCSFGIGSLISRKKKKQNTGWTLSGDSGICGKEAAFYPDYRVVEV